MAGMYKQTRKLERLVPWRMSEYDNRYPDRSNESSGNVLLPGRQTTTSYRSSGREEDRVPEVSPSFLSFPTGDTGHPFDTVKETVKAPIRRVAKGKNLSTRFSYSGFGPVLLTASEQGWPPDPYSSFPQVRSLTDSESNTLGAKYILATAPTAPQANLLLTLTELAREGLPDIPAIGLRDGFSLKKLGGESLNYQFGIAPLISDLQSIAKAVITAPDILEQFRKDSGKLITRRRMTVHAPETNVWYPELYPGSPLSNAGTGNLPLLGAAFADFPASNSAMECLDRVETTTRFVGAYQYELDIGDDAISRLRSFEAQANHLLGLRLTPELLWNLAPWSWLTDWYANIGDILGNASNFMSDGLVMKYGYLMRHTVATRYLTYKVAGNSSYTPQFYGTSWTTRYRTERKERVQATPYGFGITPSSLSGYQTGILASLGSTYVPEQGGSSRPPRRR